MKYALLAAALVLTLTACDQMREKTLGEGKPVQYPPSLWEKREGQVSDGELEKAAKEAEATAKAAPAPEPKPELEPEEAQLTPREERERALIRGDVFELWKEAKRRPKELVETSGTMPASPEFDADAALSAHRDAYIAKLKGLKPASYTFNTPSPIKVATPVTVYFWLDPLVEPMRLAEELKAKLLTLRPGETPQTEAGHMKWSPKMRAKLTGDDFDITPNFGVQKTFSATDRTEWSWDVKARHVGSQLPLHLEVWAVLPQELGEDDKILTLDKLIHVEVTFLWLLDEHWDKYWKWILGGLGGALATAIGAWWKRRQPKATEA